MKVVKRNGSEVVFDITKIIIAITKANDSVEEPDRMTPVQIQRIADKRKGIAQRQVTLLGGFEQSVRCAHLECLDIQRTEKRCGIAGV